MPDPCLRPCAAVLAVAALAASAAAQPRVSVTPARRPEATVRVPSIESGVLTPWTAVLGPGGQTADECSKVATHTNASFEGGSYVAQQGFAQGEIAAATYTVPADQFPIKFELAEMIFVTTGAVQQTVTEWSFLVWDGPPNAGPPVAQFSSELGDLPQIVLGPGNQGVNVQVAIDPGDPEQIILVNPGGTGQFTIGYRIDKHNNPPQNNCLPPSTNSNLFPTTDVGGLQSPAGNWIFALQCAGGCPGGWKKFSELGFCQPSGDWVMRATWSSLACQPDEGACCLPNGDCTVMTEADCLSVGGVYKGAGTPCDGACPAAPGACCFGGGGCLTLSEADCVGAGGTWLGANTQCAAGNTCPTGACCLPNGSCTGPVTATECGAMGGVFKGVGTACGGVTCPQPAGACCLPNGGCLSLTQSDCAVIPNAVWKGAGTDCSDGNSNGQADDCEETCYADCEADQDLDIDDFICFQTSYALALPYADCEQDNDLDIDDFVCYQTFFAVGCP
jgi:hypothetical protein